MLTQLPVISTREPVVQAARAAVECLPTLRVAVERVESASAALDFLSYELPDLAILDFADERLDALALMQEVEADPWLLSGGIIAVYRNEPQRLRIDGMRAANIVIAIADAELDSLLPRALRTIGENWRLLAHRGLGGAIVGNLAASFQLDNHPLEVTCYVNLVCNFLHTSGRCDATQRDQMRIALTELLLNAIEHGNCGITSAEKQAWLDQGGSIAELIEAKCRDEAVAARKVRFDYRLLADRAEFCIRDHGPGFDWRARQALDPAELLMQPSGRGVLLAQAITGKFEYNDAGNEVSFEVAYNKGGEVLHPGLFNHKPMRHFEPGDVVIDQGQASDTLYFIVDGRFDVRAGGVLMSQLTPDDIFLGEMSFLLNARRSASIVAATAGTLIAVDRREFVEGIRAHPRYALFLAKLLARRLADVNARAQTGT